MLISDPGQAAPGQAASTCLCAMQEQKQQQAEALGQLPSVPASSASLLPISALGLRLILFYFFLLGCQHGCFGERCRKSTSGPNDHLHLLQGAICACKAVNKSLISLAARLSRAGRGGCFLEQLLNVKHCINKHKHTCQNQQKANPECNLLTLPHGSAFPAP